MDSTFEILLVGALVALLTIFVTRILFKQQKLSLPPGPTPLPLIGSLHLLGTHPHQTLANLAQNHYGPLMSIRLGQRLCVVASSREAGKEFLKMQDAKFCSRPPLRSAQLILPKDIVLQDLSPQLRHMRKILVSELMNAKRLEASRHIRTEEMAFMLKTIAAEPTSPIQVKTHLNTMSNNILTRMILSKRFLGEEPGLDGESGSDIREFLAIVAEESECFSAIHLQDFFNVPEWFDPQGLDGRFRRLRARMDMFYTRMIDQHKEDRRRNPVAEKTLLDVLLQQLDDPTLGITEEHIRGVIWDALSAGTDTTVLTSEWAMAELLRNPSLIAKARSELNRVVGLSRTVEESDIPCLPYIQAIVKETFRLHPPLPMLIPHYNTTPTKVFSYDVPSKVRVFVNVWAIGRDPRIWEHPLEFQPERFMSEAATIEFQGQHFELVPFGSGRRLCPGLGFASVAVHLQVANLLHAFEWSLCGEVDMTEAKPGLTLPKRDPLVAVAKPRLPSHVY